jgi:hypothetical protein
MQNLNQVRPIVMQLLSQQHYTHSGNYHGIRCFLSAYQIAVLVNAQDGTLRGTLSIGGEGEGPDSFARQIAWHLSREMTDGSMSGLEMQFFSIAGLDAFTFDGGNTPSAPEFSMFRLEF